MKLNYVIIAAAICGLSFQSCSETSTDENKAPENTVKEKENLGDDEDQEKFTFVPPSPLQIASIFNKAGLVYDANLPNKVEHISNYTSKFKQSLNFGVYSSDLAYSVKNEKYDEASKYLKALKDLSGKIGLETVFASEDLIERFNSNVGNQDSIIDILIFVQENTDDYIAQNGKVDLAVIYYSGAWVEGMYFGAVSAKGKTNNSELGALISEQMTIARSIVKGLNNMEEKDMDSDDISNSIQEIIDMFDNFESVKALGEDAAYFDIYLTEAEVAEISNAIIELRTSIIE
jgi:hypothetical protein